MAQLRYFWGIFAGIAVIVAIFMFHSDIKAIKENAWQIVKPKLREENLTLKYENDQLKSDIAGLKEQNLRLKKSLGAYENEILALKEDVRDCYQGESMFFSDLPEQLAAERFEIRQKYRELLKEKMRWDRYRQQQYENILESTLEPEVVESQSLNLVNEENLEYFLEIEGALKLHRVLVRDIRMLHDEIQFQKEQFSARQQYQFYDLKFKLSPFARESGLTDALQQAMSALSAGIYQQEAVEVLNRLGEEFTKPVRQLYERLQESTESAIPIDYNYNIYIVFGKKLMDYSDALARQPFITLDSSVLGELDFFNRRVSQSLYDLYQVGQNETISSSYLDLEELERVIETSYLN